MEEFAAANASIRALVIAALLRWWQGLDLTDPLAVVAEALEFVPALVTESAELASVTAADFYDAQRITAGAPGDFLAVQADPPDPDAVAANVRWSAGPLFKSERQPEPDPAEALARLDQTADRMVLQAGRDTIDVSTGRDPAGARWARVPTGAQTCAFCLLLASRGPVYRSEKSAGGGAEKFHARDDCQAVPFWPGDPYPEGYEPDALYDKYAEARRSARSGDTKKILAALRAQESID